MARNRFLLSSVVFFFTSLSITVAREGSNISSCNSFPGSPPTTCTQGPCVKFPCTMQCGLKSSYESCQQQCGPSICNTLNCTASQTCNQTCQRGQCGELSCNAPNCFQDCFLSVCNKMICSKNAAKCVQSASAEDLICEAQSCDQTSSRGYGNVTCSKAVKTCNQQSVQGRYNMTCAPGVETCTQTLTLGAGFMRCDADVCKQNCTSSDCDMICSSNVKECHQSCGPSGNVICRLSYEADNCKADCPVKMGRVGCTFSPNYNTPKKNDAAPAIHLTVSCYLFLQSLFFMIKYL